MAFTPGLIFGSPSRGLVRAGQVERIQQFSNFRFSPSAKIVKSQPRFGQSLRRVVDQEDSKPSSSLSFLTPLPGVAALDKIQRLDSLRATFSEVRVGLEEVERTESNFSSEEITDHFKLPSKNEYTPQKMRSPSESSEGGSTIPRRDCGRMKADSKFKRFNTLRTSLKKIKTSVNASNANGVTGRADTSIQDLISPVKSKGLENSNKLDSLFSPFKKDDNFTSPMKRKEEPELKIRIVDENSDFTDIVKDATTMSGFSSSILAKYRRHRMSLMFEDRRCEHIDLGSEFLMCLE